MADSIDNLDIVINAVIEDSQKEQAMSPEQYDLAKWEERRKKFLEEEGKTQEEIEKTIAVEKKKQQRELLEKEKEALEERVKNGITLEERWEAQKRLDEIEAQEQLLERAKKKYEAITAGIQNLFDGITSKFDEIKQAGVQYADYVERIEVGLIGSTRSYDSVTSKLEKVFSMNVFFSLDSAIQKATEMVEQGISYNTELRAALAVTADKIAKTFDAFDANLLRLIRIQQEDSTQARLGMESLLLNYLNGSFQNSEYLAENINATVTSSMMEALSRLDNQRAVELEYSVQKWLGSLYSVGVSQNTVQALSQGIGYLGSGDVSSLTQNTGLQQLLALSIERGGGNKSYGEMLLNGITAEDVNTIFSGFYSLVEEISSSDNIVAMNQYAKIFNLSISDIVSVLNLSAEDVKKISQDMANYQNTIAQVDKELSLSKLLQRSSYSEIFQNIKSNTMTAIGLDMADSWALNLLYETIDQVANVIDMVDTGIEIDPFGVGASIKLKAGDLVRGGTAMATYLGEFLKNIEGLSSLARPNFSLLGGESSSEVKIMGGLGTSGLVEGSTKNQANYSGASDSNIYQMVNQQSKDMASSITNKDVDEEQEKMEKTMESMADIRDDVSFIVQLLNQDGIVIRGRGQESVARPSTNNNAEKLTGGGY